MNKDVREFIEGHVDLIEDCDFKTLFSLAVKKLNRYSTIKEFNSIMRDVCDPLDYIDEIPECYWYDDAMTNYQIPSQVKKIGEEAFYRCKNLTTLDIPEGVIDIADRAFDDCTSLKSISLPTTLEHLGESAFASCDSLSYITYKGTKDQWRVINKFNWDADSYLIAVHCSDGDTK